MKARSLCRLLLLAAIGLGGMSCNEIQGDGGMACDCLGPKGKLEFGFPPSGSCVTPIQRKLTGAPDALLVRSCVALPSGVSRRPYDLSSSTIKSTNDKLVLGNFDGSCGSDCISLLWFDMTGTGDLVVSSGGVEVDRVTLDVSP